MECTAVQNMLVTRLVCRKQVREEFGEEEEIGLAQSIREHGILQPLLVHREGDYFVVVDGERRLRAAKRAGLAEVPVIVEDRALGSALVIQRQLVANCQRSDLSQLEKARAIDRLIQETKWSAAEVAMKLGISESQVSKLTALLLLPEDIQEKISQGKMRGIAASTAYELAKIADPVLRSTVASEAIEECLSRNDVVARIKRATAETSKRPRRRTSSRVLIPLGQGRKVAVSGPGMTLELLVSWIEELLGRIRAIGTPGLSLGDLAKALSEGQPPTG